MTQRSIDVARLGLAIDDAFDASPLQRVAARREPAPEPPMQPLPPPPTVEGRRKAIAAIAGIGAALATGLILLWGSTGPRPPGQSGG
jgi:hypothetical protein